MHKGIRQSMAWLHSWTGLIFGWLVFAIFLMGSLSYYRHEINLWMQPALAQYEVKQDIAIKTAYQYLQENAPDAKSWYLTVATLESPVNTMYWEKADGGYGNATLDANTGKELQLSATLGGDFLSIPLPTFWHSNHSWAISRVSCRIYYADCFGFRHYYP